MTQASPTRGHTAGISYLRQANPGLPLVLLHGIGSNAESWNPLLAALPSANAIAWDAPGYGTSEPLADSSPTPAQYAARLHALLDALDFDRVLLVGHSLGTLFAASFAAAHPDRIAALALVSPSLGHGVAAADPLPASVQGRIDDLRQLGAAGFAAKRAPRLIHRSEDKPAVLAGVRRSMEQIQMGGYAQAVRALGAGKILVDAARTTAPTLVAIGEHDVITPPDNARAVYAAVPHAVSLRIVPGTGHALPQEAPGILADLLTQLAQEAKHV